MSFYRRKLSYMVCILHNSLLTDIKIQREKSLKSAFNKWLVTRPYYTSEEFLHRDIWTYVTFLYNFNICKLLTAIHFSKKLYIKIFWLSFKITNIVLTIILAIYNLDLIHDHVVKYLHKNAKDRACTSGISCVGGEINQHCDCKWCNESGLELYFQLNLL